MTVFPLMTLADAGVVLHDCEHKTPAAQDDGYPYIAIPNIQSGRLKLAGTRLIDEEQLREWNRRTTPQAGDVIVTRRGRVGDSAVVPAGLRCAIGQNLVILRSNGEHIDQRFLRWLLRGPAHETQVAKYLNMGAVFDSLNCADIPRFEVVVPPLREQIAIAELLGALEDKIEVNQRIAALLAETARTRFVDLADEAASLASVATVTMGSSPPGNTYNEVGDGLPFYQGVRDFGERSPGLRIWCSAPSREAQPGDTLVAVRAPVGRLNRAARRCAIGRGLASVAADAKSCVYYALATARDAWRPFQGEGTVFAAINAKDLRAIEIKWPSSDRLPQLERELSEIDDLLDATYRESETLAALRDTLLPELLSGRLRVPEAEDLVADAV